MLSALSNNSYSIRAFYVAPLWRECGLRMFIRAILRENLAQIIIHAVFHILFAPVV